MTLVLGDNGFIQQSKNTRTETEIGEEKEIIGLAVMSEQIKDYKELHIDSLREELQKNDKIDTVEECTKLPNVEENKEDSTYAKITFKSGRIYYVVLKSTDSSSIGKIYEGTSGTEIEEIPEIPEGLKEGETVTYSPSGIYNWQAKYASSDLEVEDEKI